MCLAMQQIDFIYDHKKTIYSHRWMCGSMDDDDDGGGGGNGAAAVIQRAAPHKHPPANNGESRVPSSEC